MPVIRRIVGSSFHILALIVTVGALFPLMAIVYWALDRQTPVANLHGQFDQWDESSPYNALISWTADRHRICQGKAFRWVFGDRPYNIHPIDLPPPGAAEQLGGRGVVWTVSVPIPAEALRTHRKTVTLRVRLVWQCNPLQQFWPIVLDAPDIAIPVPTRIR
jgi:hypothetical protein